MRSSFYNIYKFRKKGSSVSGVRVKNYALVLTVVKFSPLNGFAGRIRHYQQKSETRTRNLIWPKKCP